MGNHNRSRTIKKWIDLGFQAVYDYPIIYDTCYVLSHAPPEYKVIGFMTVLTVKKVEQLNETEKNGRPENDQKTTRKRLENDQKIWVLSTVS